MAGTGAACSPTRIQCDVGQVRADGEAVALRMGPFVGQMADKVYTLKGATFHE
jgi:hypothetical protein